MADDTALRIGEITGRLWELVKGDFGGCSDPERVREVKNLTQDLRLLLPNNALSLRIGSLVSNVEIACSPARWRREGLERVQQFAREDAYVIKGHA